MSGACAVEAAKATMRLARKIGLARVISLRCPGAIHGVLVTSTSPGCMWARPIWLMNCFTVTGSVPMKEGMLSLFCASSRPAASVRTHAKSFDSFTSVENDARRKALAASSTAEMARCQRISRVTASNGGLAAAVRAWIMAIPSADADADVAAGENLEASLTHDQCRFPFLDDRRAVESLDGRERIAVVN